MAKTVRRRVSVFINGKEVAGSIKEIKNEFRRLNNQIGDLKFGTEEYDRAARRLAELSSVIRQHRNNVRGIDGAWQKASSGINEFLGLAGIAFTADAIIDYGRQLFRMGIEMDQLARKSVTVLGPALAFVEQKARENATAMGLTTTQYINQTAAIADILIPMGFQREKAAELSSGLLDLSGALSEWDTQQRSSEEIALILSKAITGEREQLKTLGIVIQEADVKNRLMEKGLSKLTGKMLQQAKAAATLELITERSLDAQTSYSENSDSMARKQAELTAKITDVSEKLAIALIPVFTKLIDFASGAADVLTYFSGVVNRLSDPVKAATDAFDEQTNKVANLEQELNPLLDRYEELTAKTSLTEAEQEELAKVIQKIGEVTPTAITEIDEYGRVLSINTDKSREFLEQEKARLKFINSESIVTLEQQIEGFESIRSSLKRATEAGESWAGIKYSPNEITNFRKEVEQLTLKIEGARAQLRRLSGDDLGTPDPVNPDPSNDPEINYRKAKLSLLKELAAKGDELALQEIASREKAAAAAEKTAEREVKALEKKFQKLLEVTKKFQAEELIAELSAEDQAIERIRQKFQKQIDIAKELEAKGNQEATQQRLELERIRDQAINTLREEQARQALDADLERQAKRDEAETLADLERLNKKREAQNLIDEELRTEQEQELLELELYYFNLINLAEQYGIDSTEILRKYESEKAKLRGKSKLKEIAEEQEIFQAKKNLQLATIDLFQSAASQLRNLAGDNAALQTGLFFFEKGLAAAQVIIELQKQIALINTKYAAIPGGPAFAAAEIAKAKISSVKSLATIAATTVGEFVQKQEGGYHLVKGIDDGITYRAKYIGQPQTGMLPPGPVLTGSGVLANERGREYFVAHEDLRDPVVANYVGLIDNIRRNRVTQRAEGGFNPEQPASGFPPQESSPQDPGNAQLALAISRLNELLEQGIPALIDDDTVIEIFRKYQALNESAGGSLNL